MIGPPTLPSPVLVTGATGTVGGAIVERFLADGYDVAALVRDVDRAAELLPGQVSLRGGDVLDADSVRSAVEGVGTVVHAAGLPEQWVADPGIFDRVNRGGTEHVADAALAEGVGCFVHVSTIDVCRWSPGRPFDETVDPEPKHTAYERSKQDADRAVVERIGAGLAARIVCPSGVFGPAPRLTPGVNKLIADLVAGDIPMLLPGGLPVVYNRDVAAGVIRVGGAPVGTRAILSGPYVTLRELAGLVADAAGSRVPPVMPGWVAHLVSRIGEARSRRTHRPPLIPAGALHFLESHVVPSARFATEELGWRPTPLSESIPPTIAWLGQLD